MGLLDIFKRQKSVDLAPQVEERADKKFRNFLASIDPFLLTDKKDSELPGNWKVISGGELGLGADPKTKEMLENYIEWVYANVNAVSKAVSSIQFKLYRYKQNRDEVEEVQEHEILELLYNANPVMSKTDLVYALETNLQLTGEGPMRIKKNGSLPTELWPVNPEKLTVNVGRDVKGWEMLEGFVLGIGNKGKTVKLDPWEIIFLKTFNPNNYWRGLGKVEAAARSIDTISYSEEYNKKFFQNSAVPYTILRTDSKLTPQTWKRLKKQWGAKYEGYKNAFKTAILEQGLDVKQLQTTAKDMDFLEQQRFLRDKLMSIFGTNKITLGITDDVNRANAEASERVFMKNTVIPEMRRLVETLNEFLVPIYDKSGQLFLDFEDPISESDEEKAKIHSQAVNKWKTVNEIRREEGLDDLDGGDDIWQPLMLTTMGMAGTEPEEEPETEELEEEPIEEPATDEEELKKVGGGLIRVLRGKRYTKEKLLRKKYDESVRKLMNRDVRIKRLKDELKKKLAKIVERWAVGKAPKKFKSSKETIDKFWHKQFIDVGLPMEKKIRRQIREKIYKEQKKDISRNIRRIGTKFALIRPKKALIKSADDYMFNKEKYVKATISLFLPLMEEILKEQGMSAMELVGSAKPYEVLSVARRWLNSNSAKIGKQMTKETYGKVRKQISKGLAEGEGEVKLIKRIDKYYRTTPQAQRVARTEMSRATGFANLDAYRQSGVVEGKEWVVAHDERTCEYCLAMEQTYASKLKLDDSYFKKGDVVRGVDGGTMTIDYSDVEANPLHVNCRCQVVPVIKIAKSVSVKKRKKKVDIRKKTEELLEKIEKEIGDGQKD